MAEAVLEAFVASTEKKSSPELQAILEESAASGVTDLPWENLSQFLAFKIDEVVKEVAAEYKDLPETGEDSASETTKRLAELLLGFEGAPFTLQRLCELLLQPTRHYKSTRKLVCALDKLLTVSTLVSDDPLPLMETEEQPESDYVSFLGENEHAFSAASVMPRRPPSPPPSPPASGVEASSEAAASDVAPMAEDAPSEGNMEM